MAIGVLYQRLNYGCTRRGCRINEIHLNATNFDFEIRQLQGITFSDPSSTFLKFNDFDTNNHYPILVSSSNGIDQYGYPYGMIGAHPNLSHLSAAAQAQLAVAASGSGQMKLDNQH